MPSDRQTTDRETFWAAHAEHGGMWRDLGTETGLVVDCCRCGLCHVVSGGEPASHRQTEIDRIFRAEADRYLAMADEERDNPYERHAYLKARHAEQMLHYAVAAAVEAELSRVQQERDEARKERDAAHAHACEAELEERQLRAERDALQQEKIELGLKCGQILGPEYDGVPFTEVCQRLVALQQEIATLKTVCPNCAGMMRPEPEASGLSGVYCPECRERDAFQDDRIAALTQEIATLRQQIGDVAERLAGLQEGDSRSPDWYHAASIAEEWVRALLQKGQ